MLAWGKAKRSEVTPQEKSRHSMNRASEGASQSLCCWLFGNIADKRFLKIWSIVIETVLSTIKIGNLSYDDF